MLSVHTTEWSDDLSVARVDGLLVVAGVVFREPGYAPRRILITAHLAEGSQWTFSVGLASTWLAGWST